MSDPITREDVLGIVKRHLVETIDGLTEDAIDPSKSIVDLGARSLDIVEVVACSMRELKIKVPRDELMLLENVGELVDLLHGYALQKNRSA
jgi:acyl carrier protein